ncbi:MAG: succinyl-diaminopimelate desuccinylase [Gammaproteobacteria bacterium]|jgi:succinyl-diaminopimelate desuccinylase|nr:succinyl-diaminopimelate desuccinylase [Gammaproteobacteria bacterium]
MLNVLDLAKLLIERPSITPNDAGCQELIGNHLGSLGFELEFLQFGEVTNLWASKGNEGPLFVFAGHTDVVPPGDLQDWANDPFIPTEVDGFLYGRGAADMKGSLAAMVVATEQFLSEQSTSTEKSNYRIGFLITSDEEGAGIEGTKKVIETLQERGTKIDYCIIGEPSSVNSLGDTVKIGRRGSLSARLKVIGSLGHVAYPHLASNPIIKALPALNKIADISWDEGNESFPPSSFQISNINAGTGANNVIPGNMVVDFNIRFSTELTANEIKSKIEALLTSAAINYEIDWQLSGNPFLTENTNLREVVSNSIFAVTGLTTDQSTSGGTSDGRFIAPTGAEVVELGPCNATIHKVDECVRISDLDKLTSIYKNILENIS